MANVEELLLTTNVCKYTGSVIIYIYMCVCMCVCVCAYVLYIVNLAFINYLMYQHKQD